MSQPSPEDLLARVRAGDKAAAQALFVLVYGQLRGLAGACLRGKAQSHTLQPTALVHEAFLRLVRHPGDFADRGHFVAVAATAMRQILTDHARRRAAGKRGGGRARVTLTDLPSGAGGDAPQGERGLVDVLLIDAALTRLAALSPRQARVVELRYFGGMSVEEVADVLGVSRSLVESEWRLARAWLRRALAEAEDAEPGRDGDAG